jgi:hypothetical protein
MASTANALNINPDGIGQVLVYPYYTVNKGNQTLISVVNTTSAVKAVKVRFLEGRNSREVLDFNLYLSPFDVWVGAITATGTTGPARLSTPDTSCTVPAIPGAGTAAWFTTGVDFRNFEYSNLESIGGQNKRDHPSSLVSVYESLDRTREGYLEMIDMGVIQTGSGLTRLAEEATHARPGTPGTTVATPANCNALVQSWTPGVAGGWNALGGQTDVLLPNGGLYGGGSIVDVANGTMISYNADAIDGFYTNANAPGNLHTDPGFIEPSLGSCDNGAGNCNVFLFENLTGRALQLRFAAGGLAAWDAVSSLYMSDAIFNEYVTETGIASKSEWVVNFPTKEIYVQTAPARPPFTNIFPDDGQACEPIAITIWNREEISGTPGSVDFSPRPPQAAGPSLCFEAQIVTFNQTLTNVAGNSTSPSGIFGSTYARNLSTTQPGGVVNNPAAAPQLANGHTRIQFNGPQGGARPAIPVTSVLPGGTATVNGQLFGLPVTGFWAWTAVNANAQPGLLANFSGAFRHRSSRVTSGI